MLSVTDRDIRTMLSETCHVFVREVQMWEFVAHNSEPSQSNNGLLVLSLYLEDIC